MLRLDTRSSLGSVAFALALTLLPTSAHNVAPPDVEKSRPTPRAAGKVGAQASFPSAVSQLWLVPPNDSIRGIAQSGPYATFARGVKLLASGQTAEALPLVGLPALAETELGNYSSYYVALAELRLGRPANARQALASLSARRPTGYLAEASLFLEAETAEALNDLNGAQAIYERLVATKTTAPEDAWMGLARVADATGNRIRARQAYERVHYEFPLSDVADAAERELIRLGSDTPPGITVEDRYRFNLGRAERLFGARRYADARRAFEALRPVAKGEDDQELIALRIAESDHYMKRYRAAREGLAPFQLQASRLAEARFFYLTATRQIGDHDEYVRLARQLVKEFPDSSWAEETLNNLATHYILDNEDQQANAVFRELSARFPGGRHAERAAWKTGWWSYKNGQVDEAAKIFESAASTFPRSDYRPSYLYWAARAHDRLGDRRSANDRYARVTTDYLNTYYGRLATRILGERGDRRAKGLRLPPDTSIEGQGSSESGSLKAEPQLPPSTGLIRILLSLELYDDALEELQYAQHVWGDTPVIQATLAWVYSQDGDLRRGISSMKKAYPQYMAAGGESLPPDLLKVLFPLQYWSLIQRYSQSRNLDPYLIAALIAQESTFVPDIRSRANAIGLMQIVPSTGRRYARSLRLRRYRTALLETPDTNLQLGTAYFSDLLKRFGGDHYALAGYNAGEHRVARWIAERPGLARDEFIDDIPFPETQNYVKKILGSTEDYRRLYADEPGISETPRSTEPRAKPKATSSRRR